MNNINDLAIVITKKIESEMVRQFYKNKEVPSFYNIRKLILDVLQENMDVLSVRTQESQEMLYQMKPSMVEDFKNDQLKKQVYHLVENIIESEDHFEKFVFKDEYDHFRDTVKNIIVIKTGKISRESK